MRRDDDARAQPVDERGRLSGIHRVRAADRDERHIAAQPLVVGVLVGVAGDVVGDVVHHQQVSQPAVLLGMEAQALRLHVVCGHGVDDVALDRRRLACRECEHGQPRRGDLAGAAFGGDEDRAVLGDLLDVLGREVVVVRMGDDHRVRVVELLGQVEGIEVEHGAVFGFHADGAVGEHAHVAERFVIEHGLLLGSGTGRPRGSPVRLERRRVDALLRLCISSRHCTARAAGRAAGFYGWQLPQGS